jgi:hypothetical protein
VFPVQHRLTLQHRLHGGDKCLGKSSQPNFQAPSIFNRRQNTTYKPFGIPVYRIQCKILEYVSRVFLSIPAPALTPVSRTWYLHLPSILLFAAPTILKFYSSLEFRCVIATFLPILAYRHTNGWDTKLYEAKAPSESPFLSRYHHST